MVSRNILKKLVFLSLSIFIIAKTTCYADTYNGWPVYEGDLESYASIVLDAGSNVVLYEKNPDAKVYPASITKIMTALVVLDKVKNLDEEVFFTYNACNKGIDRNSTTIGASAGDKLSVKECLYAILLPSANDAANALAEHVAGNINDFTMLMNEKAKMLGMENTHFNNPSGLHDEDHYSTARDLGKMMSYAVKIPYFLQVSGSLSFTHAPIRKYKNPKNSNNTMLNTNSLIMGGNKYYYKYAVSGKTGHTGEAGYCLAASAIKNDMHLVCITMNSKGFNDRFVDSKNLFNFYFDNYVSLKIKENDPRFSEPYGSLSIENVDLVKSLEIICDDQSKITLPKDISIQNVKSEVHFSLRNSNSKNAIGYIEYFFKDNKVGECEILGENLKVESINVGNLDISSIQNTDINNDVTPLRARLCINTDRPIYRDELNNLKLSKPFKRLINGIIIVIILLILFNLTRTRTFIDINESLDFLFTRLKAKTNFLRKKKKK